MPDDVACSQQGNCGCGPGGNDSDYFLSYRALGETLINIDIVVDDTFPCDLFEFYFGVPRNAYHIVKASATVIPNCDSLGPYSTGFSGSVVLSVKSMPIRRLGPMTLQSC